ncbi:DUF4185 domain-containing protein [Nocardia sp. BMG51109]|uniref:DUF4185 domain-containing protein n=1 Tax=Nocardia sp. BMG51109 TaxID=1056816 RepID=UPI0012ECB96F|nr:DUF4185 domain-containing protein [Nocardia sp. BMG51109]
MRRRVRAPGPVRSLVPVVVAAAGLGLVAPWPVPGDAAPSVVEAGPLTCFDAAVTAYGDSGRGWTGGDSTWSAALPGGREVFAFSDTFLPPVDPPGRPPDAGFVHNSFVVRAADGRLTTLVGGTAERPAAVVEPADPEHWFWFGAATYLGGALQVPLTEWRSSGPGPLDLEFVGSSVARFDEHDLRRPVAVTPLPRDRGIQWGQWIQPAGDRTYVYGVETAAGDKHLHVARVEGADLRNPMSFWTGRGWSDSEAESARVADGINAEFSVHPLRPDRYLLVTMAGGDGFSDRLIGRYGPTPRGPFGPATTLYTTPETGAPGSYHDPDVYTYNAHAHPEFSTPTRLVVTYNVNSIDTAPGGDVYRRTSIYRPRTVLVTLKDELGVRAREGAAREICPRGRSGTR